MHVLDHVLKWLGGGRTAGAAMGVQLSTVLAPTTPPTCRVLLRSLDVGVNVDGVITMLHDYTQVGAASGN